ncbi:DEKNAAC100024 [Brettanomyces naardenensis]|uniref:DEKNAAC100024 n=1 Tax=Brettanomyces naardenensis TaxID=13370 RepID=A0A448YFA5_BRENA|nr:DEKNAAC100024 [Brettanomyces naardenensis]
MSSRRTLQRPYRRTHKRIPLRAGGSADAKNVKTDKPLKDSAEYLNQLVDYIFNASDGSGSKTKEDNSGSKYSGHATGERVKVPISNALDLELYALFGLLLREFVLSWYKEKLNLNKDEEFIGELVYALDSLKSTWTSRIRQLDWSRILLDDLFEIVNCQMLAFDEAKRRSSSRYSRGQESNEQEELVNNFLRLNGHFCMDPQVNERYYSRILMKFVVAESLPAEDLNSKVVRDFLVAILNDLVMKNIMQNLPDNFVMWDMIGAICDILNRPEEKGETDAQSPETSIYSRITSLGRSASHLVAYSTSVLGSKLSDGENDVPSFAAFRFFNNLFHIDIHYPMLYVFISKVSAILSRSSKFSHWINNVTNNLVYNAILTEKNLAKGVQFLRHLMFPNDEKFYMKPRYIPQTPLELEALRLKNKQKVSNLLHQKYPALVKMLYQDDKQFDRALDSFLEIFRYKEINKSLLWQMFDLLFANIFPEILENGSTARAVLAGTKPPEEASSAEDSAPSATST